MKKSFLWLLGLTLLAPTLLLAAPANTGFDEGIEYQRIVPAVHASVPPGKVEVVELFWYGCPHCYHFEPFLNAWLKHKPANVVFRRVPAQLNPSWEAGAAAFYTAELLGVGDKVHEALFDAVQRERQRLDTPEALARFFAKYGISKDRVLKVYHSFALRVKLAEAKSLAQRYGAHSVPTIIVDGKYRTNGELAGGTFPKLLQVVDYLVAKESKAKP